MNKTNVYVYDEFSPQDIAMMQALYSRSPKSVTEHVDKVRASGSGKFMEQFYVGYGHLSIADCGSTTIFIEGLSVLADKAIQDWPMYSGQETSTRYVDMSKQPIIDPLNTNESRKILENWMHFYLESFNEVESHLKDRYPVKTDEDEKIYEKAIKARSFDILRGFLPAGISTQLSWHTNLRQAWDKLSLLQHHPLKEVREIAEDIHCELKSKYPESFSHKQYEKQEAYREYVSKHYSYYRPNKITEFGCKTNISLEELQKYKDLIIKRPEKTNLPVFMQELGNITFDFLLDYGCFRDIQRHRNGVCRMPLLTTELGFNNWYLDQLPEALKVKALQFINGQKELIDKLDTSDEIKQYYIAMGFNVQCKVTYGIMSAVYVVELRNNKTVHPALRCIARKMHFALLEKFPDLVLHSDLDLDDWDVRRGLQDISAKKGA